MEKMIENIPLNAKVICEDGFCGSTTNVILHPKTREVTHIVVRDRRIPQREWIVPIDHIKESSLNRVRLECARKKLSNYRPYITLAWVERVVPQEYDIPMLRDMWGLDRAIKKVYRWQRREQIPPGEVAIHKGAQVKSSVNKGENGKAIALQIDPNSHHVSNLIIQNGFPWSPKRTAIPVSRISYLGEREIYLKRND